MRFFAAVLTTTIALMPGAQAAILAPSETAHPWSENAQMTATIEELSARLAELGRALRAGPSGTDWRTGPGYLRPPTTGEAPVSRPPLPRLPF